MPLCLQLVMKLPSKEKDEWVRQVEREQFPENVKGQAEWAQVRAKTLHVRERYNEQTISEEKGVSHQKRMPKGAHKYQTMHVEADTKPQQRKCAICTKEHSEAKCPTLLAASVDQRWELVKSKKVCFGCLQGGHQQRQCIRSMKCGVDSCEKGHH